jgi:hypothetical protein
VFEHLKQLWMGIWQHTHTVIYHRGIPRFEHPTSMSYIYKVFEHLKQLSMGVSQCTHIVTTTEVSPDLGKFAEILDDVSVEMIPVRYG